MPNIKLSTSDISVIKKRLFTETQQNGIVRTCMDIAKDYNMHWQSIYIIWNDRRWCEVETAE